MKCALFGIIAFQLLTIWTLEYVQKKKEYIGWGNLSLTMTKHLQASCINNTWLWYCTMEFHQAGILVSHMLCKQQACSKITFNFLHLTIVCHVYKWRGCMGCSYTQEFIVQDNRYTRDCVRTYFDLFSGATCNCRYHVALFPGPDQLFVVCST